MKKKLAKFIALITAFCVVVSSLFGATALASTYPLSASDTEIASALDFLSAEQGTDGAIGAFGTSAWVVMAIAAAGEDPNTWKVDTNPSIVDYLETNAADADEAMDYARMIMAIVAAGDDPTSFGSMDFVSLLKGTYDGTQIGDNTLLNDDLWGVMALVSAGENPASDEISDSVAFILTNQNADGGWSWGVGSDSDVDDTAAAIMALIAAGESSSSTAITDALAYIKTTQMANGGFDSWGSTNADTDSWGVSGITAAGDDPSGVAWTSGENTPIDDLLSFQQGDGSFYWQAGTAGMSIHKTTACAIIALMGESFPVETLPVTGVMVDVRVEGQSGTVWSGSVNVTESVITATNSSVDYYLEDPTAIGALDEAAQAGGFNFETSDEYGSLYVTSINDEDPVGMAGWMYRVDYYSPAIGPADFILNDTTPPAAPHQEVLFYYGGWDEPPLKVSVDKIEVDVSETFTATVEYYDDDTHSWSVLEGATVHADSNYTTDSSGTVDITVDTDMTVDIYAVMDGYIRSNRVEVTVGTGSGSSGGIGLTADVVPAISFTIDPSTIDFGELGPRDTSLPQTITITNTGTWGIQLTCEVTDEAANLYVDGIDLDGESWDLFESLIARDAIQETDVTLTVPEYYPEIGEQSGTIMFWASESP